jgi:hypothetical protein
VAAAGSAILTPIERALLLLPLLGGTVFGLLPLLAPAQLAQLVGASGDDPYIYGLAGAATFGYAPTLVLGLRDGRWPRLRLVVHAVLAFNLVSLYAVAVEIVRGEARPIVLAIGATSIVIAAITVWLLLRPRVHYEGAADMTTWLYVVLVLATLSAAVFGITPLFPRQFADFFGYAGTDEFVYRQAGAATFGYAILGIGELRSGRWQECELASVMAVVFNALAFAVSVFALASGDATLLVSVVLVAAGSFAVLLGAAIARHGT